MKLKSNFTIIKTEEKNYQLFRARVNFAAWWWYLRWRQRHGKNWEIYGISWQVDLAVLFFILRMGDYAALIPIVLSLKHFLHKIHYLVPVSAMPQYWLKSQFSFNLNFPMHSLPSIQCICSEHPSRKQN